MVPAVPTLFCTKNKILTLSPVNRKKIAARLKYPFCRESGSDNHFILNLKEIQVQPLAFPKERQV